MKPTRAGQKLYHAQDGKLFTLTVKKFRSNGEVVITVDDNPTPYVENRWHLFHGTKSEAWKDCARYIKDNLDDAKKDVRRAKETVRIFQANLATALREARRKSNKGQPRPQG